MTSAEILDACRSAIAEWRRLDMPESLNKRALAEMLLISERSLTDWQSKGMPVAHSAGRGASNEYRPIDVIEWMLRRAALEARESAKDRLDRLRGDQIEREILKEDGVLVLPDDLDAEYGAMVEAARAELLFNAPDALAAELSTILGVEVDVSVIRRHIEDALNTLSHYDPGDDDADAPADAEGQAEAECEGLDS